MKELYWDVFFSNGFHTVFGAKTKISTTVYSDLSPLDSIVRVTSALMQSGMPKLTTQIKRDSYRTLYFVW